MERLLQIIYRCKEKENQPVLLEMHALSSMTASFPRGNVERAPQAGFLLIYEVIDRIYTRDASSVMLVFSDFDMGQFFFASSAHSLNLSADIPGTLPLRTI